MNPTLKRLFSSTVGLKLVMALSGAAWVGFVIAHLGGNLLVFRGEEAINAYGHFMQEGTHGAIWLLRAGVAAALVLHVWSAIVLSRRSFAARPEPYVGTRRYRSVTAAGLSARYGGAALLLFIIYHLSHLTFGWSHPHFVYGEVYDNIVTGFSDPLVSVVYIVAMVALGLHLYHGVYSSIQTVGLASKEDRWPVHLATGIAGFVAIGNISFPLAVLTRVLEVTP